MNGSVQFLIRAGVSITLLKPKVKEEQTFTFCRSVGPARPAPEFRVRRFRHFFVPWGRSAPGSTDHLELRFAAEDSGRHRLWRTRTRGQKQRLPGFVTPQLPSPIPLPWCLEESVQRDSLWDVTINPALPSAELHRNSIEVTTPDEDDAKSSGRRGDKGDRPVRTGLGWRSPHPHSQFLVADFVAAGESNPCVIMQLQPPITSTPHGRNCLETEAASTAWQIGLTRPGSLRWVGSRRRFSRTATARNKESPTQPIDTGSVGPSSQAHPAGVEPATFGSVDRCSIH